MTVSVAAARSALDTVFDPELDEPITDLGFVRSLEVTDDGTARVHLRLPTSFCAPNFAWIMASDAREALAAVPGVRQVDVELDDHHDSELINRGLAAGDDYKATFGHEAEDTLDALRATFRRKAHTASMERAITALLRARADLTEADVPGLRLRDLPADGLTAALVRRREALGFDAGPDAPVLVEDDGRACAPERAPLRLRMARSVRISVEGNSHFCRGLLTTRYPGAEADQAPPAHTRPPVRPLLPLLTVQS